MRHFRIVAAAAAMTLLGIAGCSKKEEAAEPAACVATHYPEKKRDLARVPGPMGKKNLRGLT